MPEIALIGGTGIYNEDSFIVEKTVFPDTPYGKPSDEIYIGKLNGTEIAFLHRHAKDHTLNPTRVPYRANMWALKQLGVKMVISACAVGSLQEEFAPGDLVIVDDFIDFTRKRDLTFIDDDAVHISIPEPFCPHMSEVFSDAAKELGIKHHTGGTYICIEGPRFSTKAESFMFRNFADIIGMTLVPECQLAKELGMCYCSLATVTDYDVWKDEPVDTDMVYNTMKKCLASITRLLEKGLPRIITDGCVCAKDAETAGSLKVLGLD
ncbi:MAG: S-methyl-5'-thioadenosine phosphorylase [Candidatus Methanomethylophilaceae archaeon]|jgi:5'-methylthioadenosine phosphorylase